MQKAHIIWHCNIIIDLGKFLFIQHIQFVNLFLSIHLKLKILVDVVEFIMVKITVSGAYYPGQTSDTVGYYLCAPYNTIDVSGDSAILEAKYAGAYGYYAYRISGFKMDGENRYTLLDREARANYNYNYDDFVEYVTSTNKNAYPSNGISGDYKYILQN